MKLLTNLIFEPKGKHDPTRAYDIKDTVMSEDGSQVYFALQDVPAGIALNDTEYWMLQIDMHDVKAEMESAVANFGERAKAIGTRVKGETAKAIGNPVTCLADAGSLLQPVTVLEPKQEGSEIIPYEPYSNIRPISGWDSLELNAAGKNLFPPIEPRTTNGVTLSREGDAYVLNGTATSSFNFVSSSLELVSGTYTLCANNPAHHGIGNPVIQVYSSTAGDIHAGDNAVNTKVTGELIGANNYVCRIRCQAGVKYENYIMRPQLEVGSVATAFSPYIKSDLYTVQIGETVYGGKFDWLTGKLVSEWGLYTLTGTGSAKLISASVHNAKCFMSDAIPGAVGDSTILNGARSSHFTEGVWNDIVGMASPFGKFAINTSNKIGIAYDGTIDEANAWLAAQNAAGTPVQFAYKLATPIEIQLTPHIISAVDPEQTNTLYGDGSIDVEYVKPLHVSIEERVAAAVAAAIQTE